MKRILVGWLVTVMLTLTVACGQKIEPGTTDVGGGKSIQARLATANMANRPFMYEAVGTITARTASTIASKLMGTVRIVHVREGDMVKKGELLVTIDRRQVQAQLQKAQANADVAAKEYRRYQQLLSSQSVTQQEFDRAEARHRQAQAAVAAANVGSKDATVRAPYDGRVVAKMINQGDLASPGTPFLTIEQEGLFCADLVLPERHIQAVQIGLEVQVVVPALSDDVILGDVGRIVPTADARSRSFKVKVQMPEGFDLKSGMFARVSIPLGGTGMMLVPRAAVVELGQLSGIYITDDQMVARFRLVRTGKIVGDSVEIISGLQPGVQFVAEVPPTMEDGIKIQTQ